jgi:hypothetical protein
MRHRIPPAEGQWVIAAQVRDEDKGGKPKPRIGADGYPVVEG